MRWQSRCRRPACAPIHVQHLQVFSTQQQPPARQCLPIMLRWRFPVFMRGCVSSGPHLRAEPTLSILQVHTADVYQEASLLLHDAPAWHLHKQHATFSARGAVITRRASASTTASCSPAAVAACIEALCARISLPCNCARTVQTLRMPAGFCCTVGSCPSRPDHGTLSGFICRRHR